MKCFPARQSNIEECKVNITNFCYADSSAYLLVAPQCFPHCIRQCDQWLSHGDSCPPSLFLTCVLEEKAWSRKCVFYLLQGDMVCDGLQLCRGSLGMFVGVNFCNLFPLSHSIKSVGSIANLENSVAFIM